MWNDEAALIGEWIGNDGATWIGEAGQIVGVSSIFVSIFNGIISTRPERLSDVNLYVSCSKYATIVATSLRSP